MVNLHSYVVTILALSATLLSCNSNEDKTIKFQEATPALSSLQVFEDDFENAQLADFWVTNQFSDPSRYALVDDPLNPDNKVLRIDLKIEDRVAGGWRSEMKVKPNDSFGYKNQFSFKFFLPDNFYAKENEKGIIVIQQWHDDPYPGFTWKTNKNKAGPPQGLLFQHDENNDWSLVLKTGLRSGNMIETRMGTIDTVATGMWHEFELETFWSLYEDGYFKGRLNGQCFTYNDNDKGENCVIPGKNMYHIKPNYYKMGLYRSGSQLNDRHIYFDDFKMTTGRIGYFAEPSQ